MNDWLVQEIAQRAHADSTMVQPETHLVLDLGLSSLDMLSVLAYAEQQLGARFPDEILGDLTTLSRIEAAATAYRVPDADAHRKACA